MSEQISPPQILNSQKEESLHILSELHKSPHFTQRDLASRLNISLGKTNYLIKELIKKGLIKVRNFSHNPEKLKKVKYILTRRGLEEKINLTYHFLKKKELEYNRIKEEWKRLNSHVTVNNDNKENVLARE